MGLVGTTATESEETGLESPGDGEVQNQEGLVDMVMSMEPGAMRFLQLHYEDLLASLEDVALFPLEGVDVTGFRVCDPQDDPNFASCLTEVRVPFLCSEPHKLSSLWSRSFVEPGPPVRQPKSCYRVCWEALVVTR